MARIGDNAAIPDKEILMLQETVESLSNNTILFDYFELLKKILVEGYTLKFKGYSGDLTTIKNIQHLKNYINTLTGVEYL